MKNGNTKLSLAIRIAGELDMMPRDVLTVIQKFLDHLTSGLAAGERFEFRNFGVFEVAIRKSRIGRNPRKPATPVIIPERKVVKFKPGKFIRSTALQAKAATQ